MSQEKPLDTGRDKMVAYNDHGDARLSTARRPMPGG